MALEVIWLQEVAYPARVDRLLADFIFGEGVLTGFTVSEKSGGANMSVDVAAGKAIVEGDDQANQGKYAVRSTAVENVTGFTAPGSNSRYDIVVLRINDTNAGGSSGDNATVERIAGTAAASPVAPDVPDSAILLATIGPITSSTTSITDAMIADSRSMATLAYDVVDDANASRLGTSVNGEGTLVKRGTGNRFSAGTPVDAANVATKGYVDALGTNGPTPSTIMRRDANARARVADPSHNNDIANKQYVDGAFTNTKGTLGSGTVKYRRLGPSSDGIVIVVADGWNGSTVTLPAGFRPPDGINVPSIIIVSGDVHFNYVTILANGQILNPAVSATSVGFSVVFFTS